MWQNCKIDVTCSVVICEICVSYVSWEDAFLSTPLQAAGHQHIDHQPPEQRWWTTCTTFCRVRFCLVSASFPSFAVSISFSKVLLGCHSHSSSFCIFQISRVFELQGCVPDFRTWLVAKPSTTDVYRRRLMYKPRCWHKKFRYSQEIEVQSRTLYFLH